MKNTNLKKLLSLILCVLLIAPIFGGFENNSVSAAESMISSFGLMYNDGTRNINILEAPGGNFIVRASNHLTENGNLIRDIDLTLSNPRIGNVGFANVIWRVEITSDTAGAQLLRYDGGGALAHDTRRINANSNATNTNVIGIRPNSNTIGNSLMLKIWVTDLGSQALPDTTPGPGATAEQIATYEAHFTISRVIITIVDDFTHGTLGANIFLDTINTPINFATTGTSDNPIMINPRGNEYRSRRITINNVFAHNFTGNFANNMESIAVYQWSVEIEGDSIEVEVQTATGVATMSALTPNNTVFTNANRTMTVRPAPGVQEDRSRSGSAVVTVIIGRSPNDPNAIRIPINFDVMADMSFDAQSPVLISTTWERGSFTDINTGLVTDIATPTHTGSMAGPHSQNEGRPLNTSSCYVPGYTGAYVILPLSDLEVTLENGERALITSMLMPALSSLTVSAAVPGSAAASVTELPPPGTPSDIWTSNGRTGTQRVITGAFPVNGAMFTNVNDLNLYIPHEWIRFAGGSANVTLTVEGTFISGTRIQPLTRSVTIREVTDAINGELVSFEFEADHASLDRPVEVRREVVGQSNSTIVASVNIEMDRDGNFRTATGTSIAVAPLAGTYITLDNFGAMVYDLASFATLQSQANNNNIVITNMRSLSPRIATVTDFLTDGTAANNRIPATLSNVGGRGLDRIRLTGASGTATIVIEAQTRYPAVATPANIEIRFNIVVTNIGVFTENLGNVESFNLRRDRTAGTTIPTATSTGIDSASSIFLSNGRGRPEIISSPMILPARPESSPTSIRVNISDVRVLSAASANNHTAALQNFNAYVTVLQNASSDPNVIRLSTPTRVPNSPEQPATPNHIRAETTNGRAEFTITAEAARDGRAIIRVEILPMAGTGSARRQAGTGENPAPGQHRPMHLYFSVIVNELGGTFDLVVDFEREVLMIETFDPHVNPGQYWGPRPTIPYNFNATGTNNIEFMYALRAVQDGASQRNERWLPVMGSEIDISGLIPRSGNAQFRFAVRHANDVMWGPDDDGNFGEAARRVISFGARRTVSPADRRSVIIHNGTMITFNNGRAENVLYRVGPGLWSSTRLVGVMHEDPTNGISVLSHHNPLGGTADVRFQHAPTEARPYGFASVSFRVRIPRAARPPRIRLTGTGNNERLTGFTTRMSWSTDGENWHPVGWRGAVRSADFQSRFVDINGNSVPLPQSQGGYVSIYVRANAVFARDNFTVRTAASPPVRLMIPERMVGGN